MVGYTAWNSCEHAGELTRGTSSSTVTCQIPNPNVPNQLTDLQKMASISFDFVDVDHVDMRFTNMVFGRTGARPVAAGAARTRAHAHTARTPRAVAARRAAVCCVPMGTRRRMGTSAKSPQGPAPSPTSVGCSQ